MDIVLPFSNANEVVVRLDVAVEEASRVDVFNPLDKLVGKHQDCVEGKLPMTIIEEILKTRSEQIHDER